MNHPHDETPVVNSNAQIGNIDSLKQLVTYVSECVEQNHVSDAINIATLYLEDYSHEAEYNCMLATLCYLSGEIPIALKYLHKSYFIDYLHFDTLYNLGMIYEETNRIEAAAFFYSKAMKCKGVPNEILSELECKFTNCNSSKKSSEVRVLIASPIYQKPEILNEFLTSLRELQHGELMVNYYFVDDNKDPQSSDLLHKFMKENNDVFIMEALNDSFYNTEGSTHTWKESLVWKVANFKEDMIEYAKINHYDYLFLIDSDLILHPNTLIQLYNQKVDIISNIFWTKWTSDGTELPQVWIKDHYTLYDFHREEHLSTEEIKKRMDQFLNQLRTPGVYEVGGLGACTLISRHALDRGVSFSEIKNISFWGEDRHFCIRAAALGIDLFVDTHYPALHLYRIEDLGKILSYKRDMTLSARI